MSETIKRENPGFMCDYCGSNNTEVQDHYPIQDYSGQVVAEGFKCKCRDCEKEFQWG